MFLVSIPYSFWLCRMWCSQHSCEKREIEPEPERKKSGKKKQECAQNFCSCFLTLLHGCATAYFLHPVSMRFIFILRDWLSAGQTLCSDGLFICHAQLFDINTSMVSFSHDLLSTKMLNFSGQLFPKLCLVLIINQERGALPNFTWGGSPLEV